MKNRKTIILVSIISAMLIAAIVVSYGFITSNITGNETSKKAVYNSQLLKVTYSDGTETLTTKQNGYFIPGSTLTKTFTIKNTGNVAVKYSINLTNIKNDFIRTQDITYELKTEDTVLNNGIFPTTDTYIDTKEILEVNESRTYTLTINYLNSEENQIIDSGKIINGKIEIKENIITVSKLNIYGNSVQNGIPTPNDPVEIQSLGDKTKNLFDISKISDKTLSDGTSIKNNNDGSLIISGRYAVESNETLQQVAPDLKVGDVVVLNADSNAYRESANQFLNRVYLTNGTTLYFGKSFTVTQDMLDSKIVFYSRYLDSNSNNIQIEPSYYKNIQLERATIPTEYEPYGKYKITINLNGKNLISQDTESKTISGINYNWKSDGGLEVEGTATSNANFNFINHNKPVLFEKGTYTFSVDKQITQDINFRIGKVIDGTASIAYALTKNSDKKITFTLEEDTYLYINCIVGSGKTITKETYYIQLEKGETNTIFEKYYKPINIFLDEPLRKAGECTECSDYIDYENKQLNKNIIYKEFDENLSWSLYASYPNHLQVTVSDNYYVSGEHNIMSNYFPPSNAKGVYYDANKDYAVLSVDGSRIRFKNKDTSTVEEWKNWLSNKEEKIKVIYKLASKNVSDIEIPEIIVPNSNITLKVCDSKMCASKIEVEYDE